MLSQDSLPQYDIIVETLTGAELKITVTEKDTIGYIKSRIQKYEGIPIGHQHLLYNHNELNDATEMKDIPLVKGSRLKLVLGLKGGPVSARRVVTLPDYENWFDLSDVLNTSSRQEPLTISTPGVKVLVYKDCKKNIHRLMKFRTGKNLLTKGSEEHTETTTNESQNDQWLNDNINTLEKMHQLRTKLEWKKRNKNVKTSTSYAKECESKVTSSSSQMKCNIESEIGRKLRRLGFMSKTRSIAPDMSVDAALKPDVAPIGRIAHKIDGGDVRNWCQTNEKINNNSLFFSHHRHSQPSLKVAQPLVNCVNYIGARSKSAKPPSNEYSKMKLRENIRRNRSFKTINTENDLVIDENQVLSDAMDARVASHDERIHRPPSSRMTRDEKVSSTSVQDLIEQFSKSRITSLSDPYGDGGRCENEKKMLSKRSMLSKHLSTASFENKLFVERQHTFAINNRGDARASCSSDFQLDTTNSDAGYRVFKLPSENGSSYELPKLLIREDSPVESFHSSDSQLETLALRGESPKTVMDTFTKSDTTNDTNAKVSSTESILQLYDSPTSTSREKLLNILDSTQSATAQTGTRKKSQDVGFNQLELSFLNDDTPKEQDLLKVASNEWKNDVESPPFNFMSSGDISPTEDDDDVFNSCEMLHPGKAKSVEMNEFRMMFGSSPTLLNNTVAQTNSMRHASAASFMYRRHPDTCLSSSTSDLECHPTRTKGDNAVGSAKSELPSLLRHRNNEHLDYMRSYENLDRTKIVRLRNDRVSTVRDWRVENDPHLPREESTEDFSAFTRINYQEHTSSGDFPVSFPSNESLFNINFDTFEDDVIEIDTLGMFDNANGLILPEITDTTSHQDGAAAAPTDAVPAKGSKGKKLRCAECKKKLGLIMIMRCHCEKVFCPQHRYAEAHNCSYNFKQEGRKILARENPLVVAQKLPKI
uniref:Putative ubiquitin-like domain of an1 n=1 Tax=Nyssomyia neivai TaxID=330878 RepID=A0A1L8DTS8_9DIPT